MATEITNHLPTIFQQLSIGLGLGMLVGLQRESVATRLAGVRTFPLVTVLGTLCALLAQTFGGWVIATGLVAMGGLIVIGKSIEAKTDSVDPGLTTEVALLLMFGVGAYLVVGPPEVAIAVGGGTAILLHFKGELHGLVAKLGNKDLAAIMQFVLLSFVILPILPNRPFGPYAVLNPYQIWLMVVLIVGINLTGYIAYRFFGAHAGVVLGGVLGGLISSTATTVSYSRRTAQAPEISRQAALVIMIASTLVFARMMLEVSMVASGFLSFAGPPLAMMTVACVILSAFLWMVGLKEPGEIPPQENPTELKSAILFGGLYAFVLLSVAVGKDLFGNQGLFVVAGISGLTDVDAITLSTAQLVKAGRLDPQQGAKVILLASLSNILFKWGTIGLLGHRELLRKVSWLFGVLLVVGGLVWVFG
ncbi:MAG: MgtC/SapB family protein [Blastocatellia bacterium]|nr:MgtC/SapB family protein [Blastocatellia bacterium]